MTGAQSPGLPDRRSFWRTFLASFLVQASWNYRGMQNLGFATMSIPNLAGAAREEGRTLSAREASAQTDFFNTHPYMAAAVAGMTLKLRRDTRDEGRFLASQDEARQLFMGALGAVGDDFFWASLRPLASCAGMILALSGHWAAGAAAFLIVYNVFHLRVRYASLKHGLEGPTSFMNYLKHSDYQKKARIVKNACTVLLMAVPAAWLMWEGNPWRSSPLTGILVATTAIPLFWVLLRRFSVRTVTTAGALLLAAALLAWRAIG